MSSNLQISLLGAGHLGKIHANLLKQIPEVELAGIYDIDQAKSQSAARELNCRAHDNLQDALIRSHAVIIAAATTAHYDLALDSIFQGRHVFIEKPIAATVEQAQEIVQSAKEAGVKLQIGHIERFNPAFKAIAGIELRPQFIEVHRLAAFNPRGADVAVVMDLMIHDLDLILQMVKSPLKTLHASGVEVVSSGVDIANARLIFDSGCVANVTASRLSAKKMRKMRIFQRNGYISLDFAAGQAEIFELQDGEPPAGGFILGAIDQGAHRRNIIYRKPTVVPLNAMMEEQKAFVQAILQDKPTTVTGEDGLAALILAEKILHEIQSSRWQDS